MGKWPMMRLGDVFDLQMGKTPSRDNNMYWDNGIYNWASISDLSSAGKYIETTSEKITDLAVKESGIKIVPENTVLLSFKLSLGKVCISLKSLYTNEAIMALLDKKVYSINIDYIYYLLKNINWDIYTNKAAKGKTLNKGILANIKIPLPPIDIQKHIANTLDKTQEVIDGYKKLLAELDNLVKAVFYAMFGDPVINEKGWKRLQLSELGELKRGVSKHRPRNAPELLGGIYPLIQTGDVANSDLYIKEYSQTYSEIGLRQSKMWPKGTLCITIAANIAKTAILGFDACFPDSVVGFWANEKTNNIFIHYWFVFFQSIIEAQAPESAQKNINLRILNGLQVINPPINLQSKFAEIVTKIEEQKALVKQAIIESEHLFNSLMSEYFD